MTTDFKERIKQIVEKMPETEGVVSEEQEKEIRMKDFEQKFNEMNEKLLLPLVNAVNEEIAVKGNRLEVVTQEEAAYVKSKNRFFSQVSLYNSSLKNQSIISAPYLLIEGYPFLGKVKIMKGLSTENGTEIGIDEITQEVLEDHLADFLDRQFNHQLNGS